MKKYICILFLFVNLYGDDTCTEEQVAKMIKQNISQETIDKVCKKMILNEDESEVNKLLEDYKESKPVEEKQNVEEKQSKDKNIVENSVEKEYFFWRIGIGHFKISDSDFSEVMISLGLHYYINGLDEDGIGFGISFADANKEKEGNYPQKRYDDKFITQLELIYNLGLNDSYNLAMSLIGGTYSEEVADEDYSTIYSEKETNIYGMGIYLTLPSVTKRGYGVSLFYKGLATSGNDSDGAVNDQTIHLTGAEIIW